MGSAESPMGYAILGGERLLIGNDTDIKTVQRRLGRSSVCPATTAGLLVEGEVLDGSLARAKNC